MSAPEKRPDVRAAEFFSAYEALRAEATLAADGVSLVWPSPALELAAARVLRDWAAYSAEHGLLVPPEAVEN